MTDWLIEARRHIGLREIKGTQHNSVIIGWLKSLKAWWSEDETPWCGTFVAHCMQKCGYPVPKYWMRAKDWLNWGESLLSPCLGCVVVFSRTGGGHVGFVVGKDERGRLMVLGGNQSDSVSIVPFDQKRAVGYRWPIALNMPAKLPLPLIASNGWQSSSNEA